MHEERNRDMRKYPLMLASAVLLITSGVASAQTWTTPQYPDQFRANERTTVRERMIQAPSSTNPDATDPNGLLGAPHEVPENGGAATFEVPGSPRR